MVGIYDVDGAIKAWYTYDAWGNVLTAVGELAEVNPIRYRGYYYDNETGYYYCQSGYYNPEWCRWISADVLMDTQDGILGTNMYAYCHNNPVNAIDPTGMASWWEKVGLGYAAEVHQAVQIDVMIKALFKGIFLTDELTRVC